MPEIHLKTRVRAKSEDHAPYGGSPEEEEAQADFCTDRVATRIQEFQRRYSVQYGGRAAQVPLMKSIRDSYNIDSSILVPRGTTTNAAIHVLRDKISAKKRQNLMIKCENEELLDDLDAVIDENQDLMDQVAVLQGYIQAVEGNVKTMEDERNYLLDELEVAEHQIKRRDHECKALQQQNKEYAKIMQAHSCFPTIAGAEDHSSKSSTKTMGGLFSATANWSAKHLVPASFSADSSSSKKEKSPTSSPLPKTSLSSPLARWTHKHKDRVKSEGDADGKNSKLSTASPSNPVNTNNTNTNVPIPATAPLRAKRSVSEGGCDDVDANVSGSLMEDDDDPGSSIVTAPSRFAASTVPASPPPTEFEMKHIQSVPNLDILHHHKTQQQQQQQVQEHDHDHERTNSPAGASTTISEQEEREWDGS